MQASTGQAVGAGITAAVLGYASSVAVVVAGLTAVGAAPGQVGSGLLAVGLGMSACSAALSVALRLPVAVVWSTPGVALLVTVGDVDRGFAAVTAGLALAGLLLVVTGLLPPVSRGLARLPTPLTAAVLAGVLLPFCLAPARAVAEVPASAGAVVLVWLAAVRWAPRWAAPAALLAVVGLVAATGQPPEVESVLPSLEVVTPVLTADAVLRVALPVYLVTMAAQNLVGVAVLRSAGYAPPIGRLLVATGLTSSAVAPFGGPTVNLAAITGALTAGPDAGPDPGRRWVATVASSATYLLLAALAPVTAGLVAGTDPRLVGTAAGLALLGALAASTTAALAEERERLPALVTLLVTASGVTALGVGSAPVGLLCGLVLRAVLPAPPRPDAAATAAARGRNVGRRARRERDM